MPSGHGIPLSTSALFGLFLDLALWGTSFIVSLRVLLLIALRWLGAYTCFFAAALWLVRHKRMKFSSPAVLGVICIYLLNLGRTSKSSLPFSCEVSSNYLTRCTSWCHYRKLSCIHRPPRGSSRLLPPSHRAGHRYVSRVSASQSLDSAEPSFSDIFTTVPLSSTWLAPDIPVRLGSPLTALSS